VRPSFGGISSCCAKEAGNGVVVDWHLPKEGAAWKAFQAYRLYEFLRDHFDDLM
jgi:hypothetical protein